MQVMQVCAIRGDGAKALEVAKDYRLLNVRTYETQCVDRNVLDWIGLNWIELDWIELK